VKPGPTARAALVLVAFLAVFTIVDRMSAPDGTRRTAAAPPASAAPDTRAAATTTTAAPTTTRAPTTTAPPTTRRPTGSTRRPVGGVTVQVLNGVWVDGLAHRVAAQVRTAGYQVVAANTALGNYSASRVYYTAGTGPTPRRSGTASRPSPGSSRPRPTCPTGSPCTWSSAGTTPGSERPRPAAPAGPRTIAGAGAPSPPRAAGRPAWPARRGRAPGRRRSPRPARRCRRG
jgi:LytR cell envelope-related transcriptional attenuator